MMKAIFAVVLPLALLFFSCGKQQLATGPEGFQSGNVRSLQTGVNETNLFYSLPRTVVSIDVEVRRTENVPGPYARHAYRLLGLDGVILSESHNYEIQSITINSFNEPDPEQLYYLRFPENITHNTYISLSEAGLISRIGRKKRADSQNDAYQYTKDVVKHGGRPGFNYFMDINLMERIDTIIQYVFEDTALVQRQTFRKSMVEKSAEQRAREVAEHILEIRAKKFDLISGFQEIPYTKDALEFMHEELSKLENNYLELFTGITFHNNLIYRFIHRPRKEDAGKEYTLFYFSADKGIITKPGENEEAPIGKPFKLVYKTVDGSDLTMQKLQQSLQTPVPPAKGIHYRIPKYADIELLLGSEVRAKARMLVNQFGVINALPPEKMEIDFYPWRGSIKSIGIEKTIEKQEE